MEALQSELGIRRSYAPMRETWLHQLNADVIRDTVSIRLHLISIAKKEHLATDISRAGISFCATAEPGLDSEWEGQITLPPEMC
jgi:hypothetical protein